MEEHYQKIRNDTAISVHDEWLGMKSYNNFGINFKQVADKIIEENKENEIYILG